MVNICKAYFGDFDENHIRKHFVLIYELLDEVFKKIISFRFENDILIYMILTITGLNLTIQSNETNISINSSIFSDKMIQQCPNLASFIPTKYSS